jgi:thymidine phosphorylase
VGDKVSLMLAPILAACGAVVPMISGRGLSHTGGTLDKLEALPGYGVHPTIEHMRQVLKACGCAIVGASERLAPADRRLYSIRDVTATVESIPLITASILSKKLAAGLNHLVLDIKVGPGGVMVHLDDARALARSLVHVARGAGLPTTAWITDMHQVLGTTAGNALEVREALDFLSGHRQEARLCEVTLGLCATLLQDSGLAPTWDAGQALARRALDSGEAARRFALMVRGLGGPRDVWTDHGLPTAPVVRDICAPRAGVLAAMDARAIGMAVVRLGGGRSRPGAAVDPRVGFSHVVPLGTFVNAGDPLARVHAANEDSAVQAQRSWVQSLVWSDSTATVGPVMVEPLKDGVTVGLT